MARVKGSLWGEAKGGVRCKRALENGQVHATATANILLWACGDLAGEWMSHVLPKQAFFSPGSSGWEWELAWLAGRADTGQTLSLLGF